MTSSFVEEVSATDVGEDDKLVSESFEELLGSQESEGEAKDYEFDGQSLEPRGTRSRRLHDDIEFRGAGEGGEEPEEGEEEDEEDEEEEEKLPGDLVSDFGKIDYDLARFRFEAHKAEERHGMIEKLKELLASSKVLVIANKFLHKQYITAIRNTSTFATAMDKLDEETVFADNRYLSALENYAQTRSELDERRSSLSMDLASMEASYDSAQASFEEEFERLLADELAVAKKIRPSKISKLQWLDDVNQMLENQRLRMSDVAKIRLVYLRLAYHLDKLQAKLRIFDRLGPGFSMIDYEYLVKRKKVYGEKRDEQCEYIRRLGDRNLAAAGVIKHVDEEIDLYNEKIKNVSGVFDDLIEEYNMERAKAVSFVKKRSTIFKNIMKLREQIGLLDNPYLLRKMVADQRTIAILKKRSENINSKIKTDRQRISMMSMKSVENVECLSRSGEPMEAKLAAYRNKKRREAMVETAKNTIKEALSWQRSNPTTTLDDKDDLESIISEESIDLTPPPSPFFSRTMYCLYFLLWVTLYIIAIQVQFGAVYFILSALLFVFFNTRSGPKKRGEISAYSVFNPDCQSIDGTLKAEQFEREIRYGASSVH